MRYFTLFGAATDVGAGENFPNIQTNGLTIIKWSITMNKTGKYLLLVLVVILIIPFIVGVFTSDEINIPLSPADKFIEVGGIKVRYRQAGTGKDVLLIHGVMGSVDDFMTIFDSLSKICRVTVFDRPGCGLSGIKKDYYSLEGNAFIAEELIKKLELKSPIIVGHSHGGIVALTMAVRNKLSYAGYVIIGSPAYPYEMVKFEKPKGVEYISGLLSPIPIYGKGLAKITLPFFGKGMLEEGMKNVLRNHPMPPGYFDMKLKLFTPKTVITYLHNCNGYNEEVMPIYPQYQNITKPLTVIISHEDCFYETLATAEFLKRDIKNCKVVEIKQGCHMMQFSHPHLVIEEIKQMIALTKD